MPEQTGDNKAGATATASSVVSARAVQDYAVEYQHLAATQLPPCLGFSARLNMLWDLAAAAPSQVEGRVLGLMAINNAWSESDVRKWLQKDVLPPRLELHNMVKFLAAQIGDSQNASRWEAFLVYGSPIVSSPINHSLYRQDKTRREIASMIFARITAEYAIPPSAYDADMVFQRCLTLMQKFNIYELQDFQPGHMEPFKNTMFPG